MQQLEERQLSILKKLSSLEDEVKQMSKQLGHKYGDSAPITKTTSSASVSSYFLYFNCLTCFCSHIKGLHKLPFL